MTWIVAMSSVRQDGIRKQMKTNSKLHVDSQHFIGLSGFLFYLYKEISFARSI